MEADQKPVGDDKSPERIVNLVDEEEVVLYWKVSNSWEYIRELASEDTNENKEVLAYYRFVAIS